MGGIFISKEKTEDIESINKDSVETKLTITESLVTKAPIETKILVTEIPATEEPVTDVIETESVVDMQIINMESVEVATAFDAYKAVLINETNFVMASDNERLLLYDWKERFSETDLDMTSFAIIDLDGNGVPELVIAHQRISDTDGGMANSSDVGQDFGYLILRYNDGEVYGYYRYNRGFAGLKIDGFFNDSGGASNQGMCKMSFGEKNKEVIEKIDYVESHYEKW